MSKKVVEMIFDEENVSKVLTQFDKNLDSATKNVNRNCILLAKVSSEGDYREIKNRLKEQKGISNGAVSQMRGAGIIFNKYGKTIESVAYSKAYELFRLESVADKHNYSDGDILALASGYIENAETMTDIINNSLSTKEVKEIVSCMIDDIKGIEKKEDTAEDTTEDTTEDTAEDKDIPEMVVYMAFLELGDTEKMEFLKLLKNDKYIDRIANNWK